MQENKERIIISDSSCLIELNKANKLLILNKLYDNIEVTPAVKGEYEKKEGFLPDWIKIETPEDNQMVEKLKNIFGDGESEAIVLALEKSNSLLILDDLDARQYAATRGIKITGTLGIINEARNKGIINLDEAINITITMKKNGFRIADKLLEEHIKYMINEDQKSFNKEFESLGFTGNQKINTKLYATWENMKPKLEEKFDSTVSKHSVGEGNNKIYILKRNIDNDNIEIFKFKNNFTEKQGLRIIEEFDRKEKSENKNINNKQNNSNNGR